MLNNPLREYLTDLSTRDRVTFFDDFVGDTIDLNNYALAQSQTSVNFTVAVARNGTIVGTAVGVSTASISLVTPAIWYGDSNATFEARLKINTVASLFVIEAGFVDGVPGTAAAAIADIDTATGSTMTCGALFAFNNSQTHTAAAFATIGGFTGQTFATTLLTTGFTTPVADTYMTIKVQLQNIADSKSAAYLSLNGRQVAAHTAANGAVNGGQGLAGWIYLQTITTVAKLLTVDYIRIASDRFAAE
jgi:hypothetical protein